RRRSRHSSDRRPGNDDGDRGRRRPRLPCRKHAPPGRRGRGCRRRPGGLRAGAPASQRRAAALVPRDGNVLRSSGPGGGPAAPQLLLVLRHAGWWLAAPARVAADGQSAVAAHARTAGLRAAGSRVSPARWILSPRQDLLWIHGSVAAGIALLWL